MYERILVPLDGSSAAEMVIPLAEELAAKLGSQMILVGVSDSVPADTEQLYQTYLKHIKAQVQRELKEDWKTEEKVQVQGKILMGKAAAEIIRYAAAAHAGLIAMSSRGTSSRGPRLLGNIADKVLRTTDKPVLLIRAPVSKAALKEKRLIKRILVPLDGSEVGESAVPDAVALGKILGAELVFFHVVEPVPVRTSVGIDTYYIPLAEEELGRAKDNALAYLENVAKSAKTQGLNVFSTVADYGSPAECIINYAKDNAIDLIAISTHGRTGIGRWVFGSVTDKVLHAGDTAVLVVRAGAARA